MASDGLTEKKERARGYLEGYERGLREAWDEFMSLTTKGYQPREIRILAKSKIMNIQKRVDSAKKEIESQIGESLAKPPADKKEGEAKVSEVQPGGTYLVEESEPAKSFEIFRSLTDGGANGLCISRIEPGKISKRYGVNARIIWLTKTEIPDVSRRGMAEVEFETLSPTGLDMLTTIILRFLEGEGNKVIMLGGFEYLMTHNEFSTLLRLLQNMKDRVTYAKAVMIIPFNPDLLDGRDLKRLHGEIEERL